MLSKRQVRSKARRLIKKERKTHQEAYDFLKKEKSQLTKEDVADIVSKIPTEEKNQRVLGLRVLFIVFLSLTFIIRAADFVVVYQYAGLKEILVFFFHGVTLSSLGIFGALTSRVRYYKFIGFFMILSSLATIISAIYYKQIELFLIVIPFLGVAILSYIIPAKLKVPYTKKMVQRVLQNRVVNIYEYFFNVREVNEAPEKLDLLDV